MCIALAAVVLLPGLGAPGIWEPQERMTVDRIAPPRDVDARRAATELRQLAGNLGELAKFVPATPQSREPAEACIRTVPKDAVARSLTSRAITLGRDQVSDSDAGRRLPLALLGLVTVLATAGIAMRLAGARAGIVAALVTLAMPLLVLQSRMLVSELGTACGATLILYGLVGLSRPHRSHGAAVLALDAIGSAIALAAGLALGFLGGGALLGLVVPIGGFAAAGGLGAPAIAAVARRQRLEAGAVVALIATLLAAGLIGLLAYQLYDLRDPYPGIMPPARQMLGHAIVPEGCWSWALGAVWRAEDDLRYIYDSTFEQIAYGTFPWGVLGLIAIAALLRDPERDRKLAGAIALAWAGGAWIATEAFQRKVGTTIYAGFPALALAVAVWLDAVWSRRARGDRDALPGGVLLIALLFGLAVLNLGKDMNSFAERVASMLNGTEKITYPAAARFLFLPTKLWPLVLGMIAALATGISFAAQRRRIAGAAAAVALAATAALAGFWAFGWHRGLATHLSSKALFDTYRELRKPGDQLVYMGDLGNAPRAYADACIQEPAAAGATTPAPAPTPECLARKLEQVSTRDQIMSALKRPERVFAIAPQSELCAIHREAGDRPYFVLDDRNSRNLLLSNKLDGATDKNPLQAMIQHAEPKGIKTRPPGRIVFDNKIELLGWDIPARVGRGDKLELVTYWKVLQPVGGNWKVLVHIDHGLRIGADHPPIQDRCPTSTWQPGDFIIDRHTLSAGGGGHPLGEYEVWIGFFTGASPSFRNMTVSTAPAEMRDKTDRVKITKIVLE